MKRTFHVLGEQSDSLRPGSLHQAGPSKQAPSAQSHRTPNATEQGAGRGRRPAGRTLTAAAPVDGPRLPAHHWCCQLLPPTAKGSSIPRTVALTSLSTIHPHQSRCTSGCRSRQATKTQREQGLSLPAWVCLGGTGGTRHLPRPAATGCATQTRQSLVTALLATHGNAKNAAIPFPQRWRSRSAQQGHNPGNQHLTTQTGNETGLGGPGRHPVRLTRSVKAAHPPWSRGLHLSPPNTACRSHSVSSLGQEQTSTVLSGKVWEPTKRPVPPYHLDVMSQS